MAGGAPALTLTTATGRRPRVAVVGGSPAGTMVAGVLIEQFGCSPITRRSGEAVMALLRRDDPVDLVVVDVAATDADASLADRLILALAGRGSVPVVALTHDDGEVSRAGPCGYVALAKPYSPRELHAAMQAALLGFHSTVSGTA